MPGKRTFYLEGRSNNSVVEASIESYICIFSLYYCENWKFNVCFVDLENSYNFTIPSRVLNNFEVNFVEGECSEIPKLHCTLPSIIFDGNYYIGGLCAVLRRALKVQVDEDEHCLARNLLGFRSGCLSACAERSIWTKFCEVELPSCVAEMCSSSQENSECETLPNCLMKLESHLRHPVKTHNIYKRRKDLLKQKSMVQEAVISSADNNENAVPELDIIMLSTKTDSLAISSDPILEHCFLEGIDLTLADIIVLPCVHFLLDTLKNTKAIHILSVICKWYHNMLSIPSVQKISLAFTWKNVLLCSQLPKRDDRAVSPISVVSSLYSRDSSRIKMKCRNFDPTPIIELAKESNIFPDYEEYHLKKIDWDKLPGDLHPSKGELPNSRISRKCEQLESIVSAVLQIAKPHQTVVDFCSGGGHVGLLLAYLLPNCQIFLVENKEESMMRARKRTVSLELKNIKFFQCNMNYFKADFDVGVSLHACGVATDLVIAKCIAHGAAFICCPCCYGGIEDTEHLKYPMSKTFQSLSLSYKEYTLLAHCADRTERNTAKMLQGILCMGLVDTDRKLYAHDHGYEAILTTLQPKSCSTKHNLLIGVRL